MATPPTHAIRDPADADAEWREELKTVVELMREVSRHADPVVAGRLYAEGVRKGLVPSDEWLAVSRRGLAAPAYRITRSTRWTEQIDPWREPHRLPMFTSGLLGELIYSDEPAVIDDLDKVVRSDDPAAEYFEGMRLMVTMPMYDDGVALNMAVILIRDPAPFPRHRIPVMVWQANLYGRSTLNLVLRQQLKAAYDALDREMQAVGDMQRSLLPTRLPHIPSLDLAAHYETSQRAGGDYYDLFELPDNRWGILMADVSGHGTPAAVVMAVTHAVAHLHPGSGTPPAELLAFVNRQLAARYTAGNGTFVTAFYGVYDAATRRLTYARAGHNPPRLLRPGGHTGGGAVLSLDGVNALPLGIDGDETYDQAEVTLQLGDALLFYTDGITEARSAAGGMYGTDHLDAVLRPAPANAEELLARVLSDLADFTGETPAADDRTLLAAVVR